MAAVQPIQLLSQSLQIFSAVADTLADQNDDLGEFFGHLNAYSLLLTECLQPSHPPGTLRHEPPVHFVLKRLTAFLRYSVLPDYEFSLPSSHQFPQLTTLIRYWRLHSDDNGLSCIRESLDFGSRDRRDELILLLCGCITILQPQQHNNPPTRNRLQRYRRKNPSSAWIGAKQVFQALAASSNACSLIHTHDCAARLRLATHRKQEEDQYKFETLISLSLTCHSWQETCINASISTLPPENAGVKLTLPKNNGVIIQNKKRYRLAVKRLCEQIEKLKLKPSMRLNLAVKDDKLWKDQSSRIEYPINQLKPQLSLTDIIRDQPTYLTEKVKRVLAVLLAYSVLHLHGTPWLRPSNFHADNILFFSTSTAVPLKPYIQTELAETNHGSGYTMIDDEVDPDDLPSHPYPSIVMLAVLLMELYMTRPLQYLAEQVGMQYDDWAAVDGNSRYMIAIAVFERFKGDFPDNYLDAVDRCLDPNIGFDLDDNELSEGDLKHLIYNDIVRPLEDELDQGFGNTIFIDELDKIAQSMDLKSWGQMRLTHLPPTASSTDHKFPGIGGSVSSLPQTPNRLSPLSSTANATHGRSHQDYTVGWICALPKELAAAQALLDDIHPDLSQDLPDRNSYTLGRMGSHNVVMACLPSGVIGTVAAAGVANNMLSTFRNLRFGLMVGIGGGVPGSRDVRLGDVVVGEPTGKYGGVIPYDVGKTIQNGQFFRTGSLNRPPDILLTAISRLKADHFRKRPSLEYYLSETIKRYPDLSAEFSHPGVEHDVLFASDYPHNTSGPVQSPNSSSSCEGCDTTKVLPRDVRPSPAPQIHYGLIASGNKLMRDGETREQLRKDLDIICFEMEAAGIVDVFPCLVIRGICDYADSHKNKVWQGYAAMTAAAYAKELLGVVSGRQVDDAERLGSMVS